MTCFLAASLLAGGCSGETRPRFDADRAYADLVAQCDFGPRVPGSEAHGRALDFFLKSLGETTDLCRAQRFTYYDSLENMNLELANVIASYNPKNTARIMICAHWDSRPRSEKDPDPARQGLPVMGANDGASGVAVLLELGRLFKDNPPPLGVDIILFDGEDWGRNGEKAGWFLGSEHFAANLGTYRPRAAILLDMVGDKDLRIYREAYSDLYAKELTDYVWNIAREAGSAAFVDSVKHAVSDDHIPLLTRRIQAIDIIDFDYPYWHTQEDTPDKCSPGSLGIVGEVVLLAVFDRRMLKF